jgi:hypothetical protein
MDFREERLARTIFLPVPFRSASRIKEWLPRAGKEMHQAFFLLAPRPDDSRSSKLNQAQHSIKKLIKKRPRDKHGLFYRIVSLNRDL